MIVQFVCCLFLCKGRICFLIEIDLGLTCNSNVCLNGGTCSYNNNNIRCVCPSGFAGARCEWSEKKNCFFLIDEYENDI